MKVVCVQLMNPVNGKQMADSAWVKLDAEYPVLSVLVTPGVRAQVQILTDDGESPGWFDAAMFVTSDSSIPLNWIVKIGEGGELEVAPSRWMTSGFWESFYNGDPLERRVFDEELAIILGTAPPMI